MNDTAIFPRTQVRNLDVVLNLHLSLPSYLKACPNSVNSISLIPFIPSSPLHPQDLTTSVQWSPSVAQSITVKHIHGSNPFCSQHARECEIIRLKMLFPSPCCSFALIFFSPILSLWWPSSYSALWVSLCVSSSSQPSAFTFLEVATHSPFCTLLCPEHTSSAHLCPLHRKLLQGWGVL